MDIFYFSGKSYLIVFDYFSKWIGISILGSKTANGVIKAIKPVLTTHGFPTEIIADNMPFGSFEFEQFVKEWDIVIITSSPHYSRSNGLIERGVRIAKNILRKNADFYRTLFSYRTTPLTRLKVPPCQLLFNRRIRGKLPIGQDLLTTDLQDYKPVHDKLLTKQNCINNIMILCNKFKRT